MPSGTVSGLFGLSSSRFATVARLGAFLVLAAAALLGAGCGGSSSSGGKGSAFEGRWDLDSPSSSFTLNCQTAGPLTNFGLWFELVFEQGVLTDISETSGVCSQGLALDASATALDIVNPDPYTGQEPDCDTSVGTDSNGNPIILELTYDMLSFTLLSQKAGEAPKGVLAATGSGQVFQVDSTGNFAVVDTCTYQGTGDIFHRMTKG
jgi:hypothetical protein